MMISKISTMNRFSRGIIRVLWKLKKISQKSSVKLTLAPQ